MNERIQELEKQAWEFVDKTWNWANANNPSQATLFKTKFAELIVRECTRIIANQAWESRTAGANGDWTEYNTLSRVAGQIKEHFGVEE